jgi:uncharacterized protein YndB with AHSA1/START domain
MTTQKLFKRRIRERMSKTGESYTTARGQIAAKRDRSEASNRALASAMELASDAKLIEMTGRGWDAWLSLLDRWGARERSHGETAAFLVADMGVSGWYAQTITNGYERARGLRVKHQQSDGFTIYVSRTVGVPLDVLFDAVVDGDMRTQWLGDGSLSSRSAQAGKVARFDWDGGPTRVSVTFEAKAPDKATVHVAHERLPDAEAAEAAKAAWKTRLGALKAVLESAARPA